MWASIVAKKSNLNHLKYLHTVLTYILTVIFTTIQLNSQN